MLDWLNIIFLVLIVTIIGVIAAAIRKTLVSIKKEYGLAPGRRTMEEVIHALRSEDVRCPRCNGQTFRMLGREGWHKCHSCNHKFEYPAADAES